MGEYLKLQCQTRSSSCWHVAVGTSTGQKQPCQSLWQCAPSARRTRSLFLHHLDQQLCFHLLLPVVLQHKVLLLFCFVVLFCLRLQRWKFIFKSVSIHAHSPCLQSLSSSANWQNDVYGSPQYMTSLKWIPIEELESLWDWDQHMSMGRLVLCQIDSVLPTVCPICGS